MKNSALKVILIFSSLSLLFACRLQAQELKQSMRKMFVKFSAIALDHEIASLPAGIELFKREGVVGLILKAHSVEIVPHAWKQPWGLMHEYELCVAEDPSIVAAVNGTFFCTEGVLGQLIINGKRPVGIVQMPASISRCFLGILETASGTQWVIGETALKGDKLCAPEFFKTSFFNRPISKDSKLKHLLGGGGWIIRNGRDVHMEAYKRQKFRFRKVDQDSRHTVVAMDVQNNLYILIFESGKNLKQVAEALINENFGTSITDAVFFDGGSSSAIVASGKYLVAPLYLVDKARFSALFIKTM